MAGVMVGRWWWSQWYDPSGPPAAAAAKSLQSCSTLCDPIEGRPPGSPVPGILQARTLEWVAISFSNAWKWKVKVKSLSRIRLFATPWTAAYQAPLPMGFSRQEYWSGMPLPSPLDLLSNRKKTKLCFTWFLYNFLCLSYLKIWNAFGITYSFENTMKLVGPLSWKMCMGQFCSDFGGLVTWPLRQTRSENPCGVAAWPSHTATIQASPGIPEWPSWTSRSWVAWHSGPFQFRTVQLVRRRHKHFEAFCKLIPCSLQVPRGGRGEKPPLLGRLDVQDLELSAPTYPPCEHQSLDFEALTTQDPLVRCVKGALRMLSSAWLHFLRHDQTCRRGKDPSGALRGWVESTRHSQRLSTHPPAQVPWPSCHPVPWPLVGPSPGLTVVLAPPRKLDGGPCWAVIAPGGCH